MLIFFFVFLALYVSLIYYYFQHLQCTYFLRVCMSLVLIKWICDLFNNILYVIFFFTNYLLLTNSANYDIIIFYVCGRWSFWIYKRAIFTTNISNWGTHQITLHQILYKGNVQLHNKLLWDQYLTNWAVSLKSL